MADLVISHFNEFVAAASLDPELTSRSTPSTSSRRTRRTACTRRSTAGSRCRSTATSSRRGSREVLGSDATDDAGIADATRTHRAADLAAALRAAGVLAEKVAMPSDLLASAQLGRSRVLHTGRARRVGGAAPGRCSVATVRRAADPAGCAAAPGADGRRGSGLTDGCEDTAALHRVDSRLSEFENGKEQLMTVTSGDIDTTTERATAPLVIVSCDTHIGPRLGRRPAAVLPRGAASTSSTRTPASCSNGGRPRRPRRSGSPSAARRWATTGACASTTSRRSGTTTCTPGCAISTATVSPPR